MKKLLSLILAITLALTLFASCGKTETALTATELLDLGEKYLLDLDYEQAIVYFNKVIEVEPRNSRAYIGAAEAYVGLGDTESAIDLLKTALEVFSDDEEVTIEILEMLLEIDPTNVEWYLELAQIYINSGNRTSAISILKQGMDVVGDDKTQLYAKLIEIDSDTTQWYFELAEVYEDQSNIPSAVDTLELGLNNFEDDGTKIDFSEELIEIDETNAEWYLTIAYIYINQGDTDAAIAILREGLEKASDTTEIEALLNQLVPDLSELKTTSMYLYYGDDVAHYSTANEYDSNGNIAKSTTDVALASANGQFIGDGYTETTMYECDTNGTILSSSSTMVRYYVSGETTTTTYTSEYDSYGNLVSRTSTGIDSDNLTNITTLKCTYEYDSDGNILELVTSQTNSTATEIITTYTYEYDSYGNVISETNKISGGSMYTYTYTYEYDDYGNIISETITSDGVTGYYTYEYEYEYGDDGKVQKCIETMYNADTGSVWMVTTKERVG